MEEGGDERENKNDEDNNTKPPLPPLPPPHDNTIPEHLFSKKMSQPLLLERVVR